MGIRIRSFSETDATAVSALFEAYMREAYGQPNAMTPEVLRRHVGRWFDIVLAVDTRDRPIGFAAWRETYDLHNAVSGGEIPDLYVDSAHRGRLAAIRLVAAIGRAVIAKGGKFIQAEALAGVPSRLARRITVGFPSETVYLAGRGLRELVALADAGPRELIARLPTPDASRDP
jgi:GNAT superfamily N-acetyltransferase